VVVAALERGTDCYLCDSGAALAERR